MPMWTHRNPQILTLDCSEYGYAVSECDEMVGEQSDDGSLAGNEEEGQSEDETVVDPEEELPPSTPRHDLLLFRSNRASIRRVLRKLGFKQAATQGEACVIWNLLRAVTKVTLDQLQPWQRLGTIKGCNQFNNKLSLHRTIREHEQRWLALGIGSGRIMPRAFHATRDRKKLEKHLSAPERRCAMWICKPVEAAMGQGIFVCRNAHELAFQLKARKKYAHGLLVSEYIEKPLLLRNVKFDLRVYVLVVSMSPLRMYVYEEGLVRFATSQYSSSCKTAQLTNYSVNRLERNFKNATSLDDQTSHKQSFRSLKAQLQEDGHETDKMWHQMHEVLLEGVIAMHSSCTGHQGCFQLLGFDVLFDQNLAPKILEVNVGLSLALSASILDATIKAGVVVGALNVIGLPQDKVAAAQRDPGSVSDCIDSSMDEFARAETTGFIRVFPTPDSLELHVPLFKEVDERTLALARAVATGAPMLDQNQRTTRMESDREFDGVSKGRILQNNGHDNGASGFHVFEKIKASKLVSKKKKKSKTKK